eukprot:TRINITY_DN3586_c0_g3_i1.p1 TRINITY_DN3586_c0_g3~~TRINITY_DN3586_c0_g3_i1.p1  ORF type:complete len:265 (-),score=55.28 TRINITY_DN3586_c0_g3_i1:71-865(-)
MPLSLPLNPDDLATACPTVDASVIASVSSAVNVAYGELLCVSGQYTPESMWKQLHTTVLTPSIPFVVHKALFQAVYSNWDMDEGPAPAWFPNESDLPALHIQHLMNDRGFESYQALHEWSSTNSEEFWSEMIKRLNIVHQPGPSNSVMGGTVETPEWLPGARVNIADSCFNAPGDSVAVVHAQGDCETMHSVTVDELRRLSARVANGLVEHGCQPGDAIAIDMPMTIESVYIYLGAVSYTHLRAHETVLDLVCRLLLEKKKKKK